MRIMVVLISTIALMGCVTPAVNTEATGAGIQVEVQACFKDSGVGEKINRYTGGLLNALMGCPPSDPPQEQ